MSKEQVFEIFSEAMIFELSYRMNEYAEFVILGKRNGGGEVEGEERKKKVRRDIGGNR